MELKHCYGDIEGGILEIKPISTHLPLPSLLAAGGEVTTYPFGTSWFTLCFVSHKVMSHPLKHPFSHS